MRHKKTTGVVITESISVINSSSCLLFQVWFFFFFQRKALLNLFSFADQSNNKISEIPVI